MASESTGVGMINHCFENPPRFLLVDGSEDMRQYNLRRDYYLADSIVDKTEDIRSLENEIILFLYREKSQHNTNPQMFISN
jgi:hypothetical protein